MEQGAFDFEAAAARVLADLGVSSDQPTPPLELATRLLGAGSVKLVPATALPGVGAIARVRDRWLVFLREDAPLPAKRFVLCHELAHKLLGAAATEVECDALAAALLVPRAALMHAVKEDGERLRLLAKRFGASESCIALRIGEVTERPLALVAPRTVRTRGSGYTWPPFDQLRDLATKSHIPGLKKVRLTDDSARQMLRPA
ncbi:metallopeptidase [Caudoviricetes sp.]|nr:metallopeptidase [Caudoviricetes sp.]